MVNMQATRQNISCAVFGQVAREAAQWAAEQDQHMGAAKIHDSDDLPKKENAPGEGEPDASKPKDIGLVP